MLSKCFFMKTRTTAPVTIGPYPLFTMLHILLHLRTTSLSYCLWVPMLPTSQHFLDHFLLFQDPSATVGSAATQRYWKCSFRHCEFTGCSFNSLLTHVYRHSIEKGFSINSPSCKSSFRSVKWWSKHIRSTHSSLLCAEIQQHSESDVAPSCEPSVSDDRDIPAESSEALSKKESAFSTTARFLASLHYNYNVPKNVCQLVAQHSRLVALDVRDEIVQILEAEGCSHRHILNRHSLSTLDATEKLGTSHKVDKFVCSQFSFVAPETIHLGANQSGTVQSYQYVPLGEQLKQIVQNPSIAACLHSSPQQSDTCIQDVFDGSLFVDRGKDALYLGLYYDDFNVVDPLGNKVNKYKVGAVYFSILNIPKQLRSRLQHIFLLALFKTSYVKKFGWKTILCRTVNDLVVLESSGIEAYVNDRKITIRAFVQHVSGDNLGIHSIAGFSESFSAVLSCRFCLSDKRLIQEQFEESQLVLRSEETHAQHLEDLKKSGFSPQLRAKYGVRDNCQLTQLQTFRITSCFPPDAHHGILEEVAVYTLELVLTNLVKRGLVTVDLLNAELDRFDFGTGCKNRPQCLRWKSGAVKVKQTASETWLLLRSLPVFAGKYISVGLEEWAVLTDLCDIVEFIFADKLEKGVTHYLRLLIEDWLAKLRRVFPDFVLKPKFHYLCHYPTQIEKHGPPRAYWAMRYESKHAFFKKGLGASTNRVNICKSMAERHQKYMSVAQSEPMYMRETGIENLTPLKAADLVGLPESFPSTSDMLFGSGTVNNVVYRRNDVLLIDEASHEFGVIEAMAVVELRVMFMLSLLDDVFDKHRHAHDVQVLQTVATVGLHDLRDVHPLPMWKVDGSCYVVPKWYVP